MFLANLLMKNLFENVGEFGASREEAFDFGANLRNFFRLFIGSRVARGELEQFSQQVVERVAH